MDYPLGIINGFNKRTSTALKLLALLAAVWLLNVGFVAIHEGGHSAAAASFGAKIYDVYVSPTGLEGATTHDVIGDRTQTDFVLAAGVIATTLAIIVACLARLELAVYVLGLRTIECLLNYTPGSDMLALLNSTGSDAFALSSILIGINAAAVCVALYRRLSSMRSSRTRVPAPAQAV